MKKTVNVNIGGVPFIIDEDAFQTLKKYFNEIENRLGEDSKEVMEDIESRIADIFNENISPGFQVVTLDLVKRAMNMIGNAREFGEPLRTTQPGSERVFQPKKLYRSRKNAVIGGVCAGLAEYIDLDPTLVRVVTLLLILFTGVPLLVYVILWIVIPREPIAPFNPFNTSNPENAI